MMVAMLSISLAACGGNDDDDNGDGGGGSNVDPNSLVGKWNYSRITNNGDFSGSYTFKADGTCDFKNTKDAYTYSYRTQGDFIILKQDGWEVELYELKDGVMKWWDITSNLLHSEEDVTKLIEQTNTLEIKQREPNKILYKEITN